VDFIQPVQSGMNQKFTSRLEKRSSKSKRKSVPKVRQFNVVQPNPLKVKKMDSMAALENFADIHVNT
jgi:hypothetical protein